MQSGKLIMFDGPDGVGKTTQFQLVADELQRRGYQVYTTHLLGGTPIGEELRRIMFSDAPRPATTNLHLSLAIYYALAEAIAAERAKGKVILIDRSPLSLIAYQVYGDQVDRDAGFRACQEALQVFQPDLLLLYQAPLEVLQARRAEQQKHKAGDYFEAQALAYHQRTIEGYRVAAEQFPATVIDANGDIAEIHDRTMQAISTVVG